MDESTCVVCGAAVTWDPDEGWIDPAGMNLNCKTTDRQHVPGA